MENLTLVNFFKSQVLAFVQNQNTTTTFQGIIFRQARGNVSETSETLTTTLSTISSQCSF